MKNPLLLIFLLSFLLIASCADDAVEPDKVEDPSIVFNHVDWNFDGEDFVSEPQNVSATITFTPDANVKHLGIEATMETGEKIELFAQQLIGFGGGTGTCMPIREFNALVDSTECFFDGVFLTICTGGSCNYQDSEGNTFSATQESGYVEITSCDDDIRSLSGKFSLPISTGSEDPITISGSFYEISYEYVN